MSGIKPFTSRNPYAKFNVDTADPVSLGLFLKPTVGTEAANVIEVTIQMADVNSVAVAEPWTGFLRLLDGNADACNPAAFEMDVTTGTGLSAGTQDSMLITAAASGAVVVDVTDVAGASGSTIIIVAEPVGGYAASCYAVITFD